MSEVKRYINCVIGMTGVEMVRATDYAKLAAEAQALREEVARGNRITLAMALDIAAVGVALGIPGEQQEGGTGEFIDAIRSLQKELEALRARVVVAPERLTNGDSISRMLRKIGYDGDVSYHHAREIWNACIDEQARLNGLTVSEGLLRRIVEEQPAVQDIGEMFNWQYARDQAMAELRALLNQDKENGNG